MRRRLPIMLALLIMTSTVTCYAVEGWTDIQNKAHDIAKIARSMGLEEDNPIITEASRLWWDSFEDVAEVEGVEQDVTSFLNDHKAEATALAHLMYAEARGLDTREISMVAWCVLNRYDSGKFGDSILGIIKAPYQFAYRSNTPLVSDRGVDLMWLANDVLARWYREDTTGVVDGRTLPKGYCYFFGNGQHNLFRVSNSGRGSYDFGLWNPYQ